MQINRESLNFQSKKKKEKGQKSETVLKQFTQFILKKIVINPTESVQINKETIVNLPDGIHAQLTIMPEVLNLGMKNRNDNELNEDTEHLVFNLQNQTFSETFAFNRNKFIGSLIILNRKQNETLAIEYHTEKNRKKVKN